MVGAAGFEVVFGGLGLGDDVAAVDVAGAFVVNAGARAAVGIGAVGDGAVGTATLVDVPAPA